MSTLTFYLHFALITMKTASKQLFMYVKYMSYVSLQLEITIIGLIEHSGLIL